MALLIITTIPVVGMMQSSSNLSVENLGKAECRVNTISGPTAYAKIWTIPSVQHQRGDYKVTLDVNLDPPQNGTDSGWIGPYNSGEAASASHIWDDEDDYKIKVKAKDTGDLESDWSDPLSVTMPRNKLVIHSLIERLMERFPILYQLFQRFLRL